MVSPNMTTDWLCIATSGLAIDGRPIESQWLIDAAETYSRDTYTAMLWPHHPQESIKEREFICNLGEVDALKVETDGDKTKLYAKIIPNQFLIEANRMGQKLYTSAEFISDFVGSGREYLFGLAVTDIPASLGTEKIVIYLAGEQKDAERGSLETFSLGKLKENKKSSFWGKLFSAREEDSPPQENKPPKGEETEETKMDEIKAMIQQLLDLLKDGQKAAEGDSPASDTPEVAAEEVAAVAEEIADAAEEVAELAQEVAENPEDEVKAEEFSAAKASLAKAMKQFTAKSVRAPRRPRREVSAHRRADKKPNQLETLTAQLTSALTTLSATESGQTPRPSNAPAGSKKPHEFC